MAKGSDARKRAGKPPAEPRKPMVDAPRRAEVIQGPVFTRKNYTLLAIALGVIVLGFVVLAMGDITMAPILIVAGYLVLVPLAILKR